MPGAKCHFGIDDDLVLNALHGFVEISAHPTKIAHSDGLEIGLPDAVPVLIGYLFNRKTDAKWLHYFLYFGTECRHIRR